jgi:GDP-fucose transporter C1
MERKNNELEPGSTAERNVTQANVPSSALWKETVTITAVIAFYFIISLSMVFLNKLVLSNLNFDFPLFMTWFQLVVALACIYIAGYAGQQYASLSFLVPFEFDWEIAKKIGSLTIIYVAMICFNNLCLAYVQISFYQVARSLTVMWTMIFTYIVLGKTVSRMSIIACTLVFVGFAIGSYGESKTIQDFNWWGIIFGVMSSAFVALYGIYVKKALDFVGNNQWRLLIYNTFMAIIILFPFVILSGEVFADEFWAKLFTSNVFWSLFLSGLMGYLINIAIFMQIRYTSALTNAVSGTAKAVVQSLLGWLLFNNVIQTWNGVGIFIVIFGSFWYSRIQYNEMKKGDAAKPKDLEVGNTAKPESK